MSISTSTIADTLRALPDLEAVDERLHNEADDVLAKAFPHEDELRTRAIVAGGGPVDDELVKADRALRERALEEGRNAIRKIRDFGHDAQLTPSEALGAEAIVLMVGRPAILIQDGAFFPPPAEWQVLEQHRDAIQQVFRSVGRIEVTGHPELEWIGTGWLAAEGVCVTNRHVAKEFSRQVDGTTWTFEAGMTPRIDFVEELGALTPAEFEIEEVIGVHETFDMALLRVSPTAGAARPPAALPVAGAAQAGVAGRQVFVVGYPAWDGRRNDPDVMRRIFANVFDVKRLQPGAVVEYLDGESLITHDCSTLGGNSGSCVVDLETKQVLGLHFSGRYREANRAVALWDLRDDPLLRAAGVPFG